MSEVMKSAASGSAHEAPPLDDVMLAMDVVDTLRRRERLVTKELDDAGREEDLKQRLRKIYAQQGIDVPDHVIEQGVAALKQDRFTYKPPAESFATKLARIYIKRDRWGKWVAGGVGAAIVAAVGNYFAFIAPDAALPGELAEKHAEVVQIAASENAREVAQRVLSAGKTALSNEDTASAKEAIERLDELRAVLNQEYTVQIVNRPGERTGIWRVPDVKTQARNYYIVVEAVDPTGKVLTVPIENEETGKTERVTTWGLRVSAETFEAVASDKTDNGIIEHDRFGYKKRGYLLPDYEMPTTGSAITRW